jgi:hypothetical protein
VFGRNEIESCGDGSFIWRTVKGPSHRPGG